MNSLRELSKKFANSGIGITPSAAELLIESPSTHDLVTFILANSSDYTVLAAGDIAAIIDDHQRIVDNQESISSDNSASTAESTEPTETTRIDTTSGLTALTEPAVSSEGTVYIGDTDPVSGHTAEKRWSRAFDNTLISTVSNSISRSTENRSIQIQKDITGGSTTVGEVADFTKLFKDRLEKLSAILREKMSGKLPIDKLEYHAGEEVPVIGIVNKQWTSQNDNFMIEIEDTSGVSRAVFTDDEFKDTGDKVVTDEVVGIRGTVSDDAGIIFGDQLVFPDVPPMNMPQTANRSVRVALLSDIHFGAVDFAFEKWQKFVHWMRTADEAADIEYILIAGDLVEGIGVYPGQEDELDIIDVYDQYELCAQGLAQLPSNIDIISIMGNHDAVRLAEPQPGLNSKFTNTFPENVTVIGNPAKIILEDVEFLLYHGMSLNPLTDRVPGLDIHDPTDAMRLMLEKRHLAPIYGQNVRYAPEHEDYLVIDTIPDVIHTGHVHTFGMKRYKGVTMINSGCWQYQTEFQRKLNIEPTVGTVPVIDLYDLSRETYSF